MNVELTPNTKRLFVANRKVIRSAFILSIFVLTALISTSSQATSGDLNGFDVPAGVTHVYTGVISGQKLIKNGAGTAKLSATNTFTGGIDINAGRICADTAGSLSTGIINFAASTPNTATLQALADIIITNGLNFINYATSDSNNDGKIDSNDNASAGGIIIDSNGHTVAVSGQTKGTGALSKIGTGSLTLSNGTNTNTGAINVLAGTFGATNPAAIGGQILPNTTKKTVPTLNLSDNTTFQPTVQPTVLPADSTNKFRNTINFTGRVSINVQDDGSVNTTAVLSGAITAFIATTGSLQVTPNITVSGRKTLTLSGKQTGAFTLSITGSGTKVSLAQSSTTISTITQGAGTIFEAAAPGVTYIDTVIFG